eukprot:4593737-Ditylum_brightwellii.AAC.1
MKKHSSTGFVSMKTRTKRNESLLYPKRHQRNVSPIKGLRKRDSGPLYSVEGGKSITIAGSVDSMSVGSEASVTSEATTVV